MKKLVIGVFAFVMILVLQTNAALAAQVHRVSAGETVYLIAQQYGINIDELVEKNNLRSANNLFEQQVLIIPTNNIYQVKPGDSLYKISRSLGISVDELAKENNIINWNYVEVGQVLQLPDKPEASVSIDPFDTYVAQLTREHSGVFFTSGSAQGNKIALTFDDGPDAKYTDLVLDVLAQHHVPATFFLMGERSQKYPQVVVRIIQEGHVIGNHSWSHPMLDRVSAEKLQQEIADTEEVIQHITGKKTALMRPPYGAVNSQTMEQLQQMDYKVINWSVDSVDWQPGVTVDEILINTLPDVKEGGILLLHSAGGEGQSFASTVAALPEIIYTLQVQGYEFVTVDELLAIEAYK